MNPKFLALGLAVWLVPVRAADAIPIEDFARPAKFFNMALSPDGEYVGFIREHEGVDRMCFADVATMKLNVLDLGTGKDVPYERGVSDFDWISPTRLVLQTTLHIYAGGWTAVDRDLKNGQPLSGDVAAAMGIQLEASGFYPEEILHVYDDGWNIIVTNPRYDLGLSAAQFPELIKLDTRTGVGSTVLKNPGNVMDWGVDLHGQVRVGVTWKMGGETSILYRETAKDVWRTVANFGRDLKIRPISFTEDGKLIYVGAARNDGTEGLYRFDPRKEELGEEIWKNAVYDLDGFVREPATKRLIGVRYTAEGRRTKWLDVAYAELQAAIDEALPEKLNVLRSFSRDGRRLLVTSYSDRSPETAYLYDVEKSELREFGKARGWIQPEQMAKVHPIVYPARDGLKIHGLLTVPREAPPEHLPLVVMPHGGPVARDEWGFDPLVQMLASRGYAVLQMDYRGSAGYGLKFRESGWGEVGGKIQEDIEDATRWAIANKFADPRRIAIVGASYGGYSALYALGKSPGLYRCGISIAGVSDWLGLYKDLDPGLEYARDHWRKMVGDPTKDEARWKAISPVNFADQITVPVLIIQGEADWIVPPRQARKMISALQRVGRKPESLFIAKEAHGFRREKGRLQEYKAIEGFLAKHLGPGVVGAGAKR